MVEAPASIAKPGHVLIANACSIISDRGERMVIDLARKSLLGKARERPDQYSLPPQSCKSGINFTIEEEARFLLALKLYELGKISSGKAAKIAGLSRVAFLLKLGRYKVSPFQVELKEVLEEASSGN